MKKFAVYALAFAMLFGLAACGDDEVDGTGALYTPDNSSKLRVNNTSGEKLLLYVGDPKGSAPFAGVLGGQNNWGVKNAPTGLSVLSVVPQAEYDKAPNDPKVAMSVFVFVDNSEATYNISNGSIGSCPIKVENDANCFVEIHSGSFDGPVFMTIRKREQAIKYVEEGEYYLFPLVKYERSIGGKVLGIYSKQLTTGLQMLNPYVGKPQVDIIHVDENSIQNVSFEAMIYVYSDVGYTAEVRVGSGDGVIQPNTFGRNMVSSGSSDPFIITRSAQPGPSGDPLITDFQIRLQLRGIQATQRTGAWESTVTAGKVYVVRCRQDGQWEQQGAAIDIN
ncbi:MAG: hypothetical protein LBC99_09355 [Spirochaetota bacterium]|jgi:hypothetical protein|nr:hypothetical protein [Spirochaetota bacterium]